MIDDVGDEKVDEMKEKQIDTPMPEPITPRQFPRYTPRRLKKIHVIAIGLAMLLLLGAVIAVYIMNQPAPITANIIVDILPGNSVPSNVSNMSNDTKISFNATVLTPQQKQCVNQLNSFYANTYVGSLEQGIPSCVFSEIPPEATNYTMTMDNVRKGNITAQYFCTGLDTGYYKQPDFYPASLYPSYLSPSATGHIIYGYGSYLSELLAGVKAGDNFSSCVYINTIPSASMYQGLAFSTVVYGGAGSGVAFKQQTKFSDGTKTVGTEDMSQYFSVDVVPDYILLGPTFPYVSGDWSQKVRLDIRVSPNTPSGKYMIVLGPNGRIPSDVETEWSQEHPGNYVRSSSTGFYTDILLMGVQVS